VLPDGTIRPTVNVIAGNWPLPANGKPSLLSHDDVVTFFHEFGHNVAALLSNTPYERSTPASAWTSFEAPSQMLENFVWDPTILKEISSNVDTGSPLPDDLIQKMIARATSTKRPARSCKTLRDDRSRFHTLPPPSTRPRCGKQLQRADAREVRRRRLSAGKLRPSDGRLRGRLLGYLWAKSTPKTCSPRSKKADSKIRPSARATVTIS